MGYTHYWTPKRTITPEEWVEVSANIKAILDASGIPLANWSGEEGSSPMFTDEGIDFNGVEDDGHETMSIDRTSMSWDLCKTARKPYDTAVTAILAYLDTVVGSLQATSDGDREDWEAGVGLAKLALPHLAGKIDFPKEIL